MLSLCVILAAGYLFGFRSSPSKLDFDEQEYWQLSSLIMSGEPFPFGRRTAVYPLLLACLRIIFGNFHLVNLALCAISALNPVLIYLLTLRLTTSRATAFLAGLIAVAWPPYLAIGMSFYSETLALPIFLSFLILLPKDRGKKSYLMICGVVLGICALTRPMYQLYLPVLLLVLFLQSRSFSATARSITFVTIGFSLIVAPWALLASQRSGEFVLISRNAGETLAGGLNPNIYGNQHAAIQLEKREAWVGPGKWISAAETGYLTESEQKQLSYFEKDKLLMERSTHWIEKNPKEVAQLTLAKIGYMWGYYGWSRMGMKEIIFGSIPIIVLQVGFIIGLVRNRGNFCDLARIWTLPLFVTGIALISWGSWRFRQPADVSLIIISAMLLVNQLKFRCIGDHENI